MTNRNESALGEFLSEAQEIVDGLNTNLLALDEARGAGGAVDPDLVNSCFRAVHSLKGLSGLFGLTHVSDVAHALENLLDDLRLGRVDIRPNILDLLFESVELFGAGLVAAAAGGDLDSARSVAFLDKLAGALQHKQEPVGSDEQFGGYQLDATLLSVLTEYEEHRLKENLRLGAAIYRVNGQFDLMEIDKGIEEIKTRVKPVGEIITYLPSGEADDPTVLELDILVGSTGTVGTLRRALEGVDVSVVPVPRIGGEPPSPSPRATLVPDQPAAPTPAAPAAPATPAPPAPALPAAPTRARTSAPPPVPTPVDVSRHSSSRAEPEQPLSLRSVSQTVRVDIRKLDLLMNMVGELGLVHVGLRRFLDSLEARGMVDDHRVMRREVRGLERKLGELRAGILEVRMIPLRQVFDKLSRVVRKVSRSIGKEIRLEVSGADTELDKLIVEELSDPLMHIIRNAIDHGIEAADVRASRDKPAIGTIAVQAVAQGNRVVVTVSDDGGGIDEHKVAEVAVTRGLVDKSAIREMSRRDLMNLLFLPGMSTRDEATVLSGRGVGLDVVKTNIAHLSGILDIASTPGLGTTVTIALPITLAIMQAIIVRVAGRVYAIPLNSVVESLMVETREINTIEGIEVVSQRNATLRLCRLDDLFELERGAGDPRGDQLFVVVVGVAQHRLGLVVDELVGEQDIVIKQLGSALAPVPGVAGATELGGEQTVLVLDVLALVEEALEASAPEVAA